MFVFQFCNQVTVKFRFRYNLLQKFLQANFIINVKTTAFGNKEHTSD